MHKVYSLIVLLTFSLFSFAQVVSTNPTFPTQADNVTITFNAAEGNAALKGVSGAVYAHTGVITDKSSGPSDWKYVQGNWGTDDASVKMTSIGNDQYTLTYNITSFYGVPNGENVLQMAFVFRNATGSIVGRASDGGDIYTDVYSAGTLSASIVSPEQTVFASNANVTIEGASSDDADLTLYVNGVSTKTGTGKAITHTLNAVTSGNYEIVIAAKKNSVEARDTSFFVVSPNINTQALPSGAVNGFTKLSSTSARFVITAPNKSGIYLIGDFNNWRPDVNFFMNRTPDNSKYWIEINNIDPTNDHRYQYFIDADFTVADPLSTVVLDPFNDADITDDVYPNLPSYPAGKTTGIVSYFDLNEADYSWGDNSYSRPNSSSLVIYELLIRDFVAAHDYSTVADSIQYFKDLGINAIELMPPNEFEGNNSWGYNPSFHNSLDKYYGDRVSFKSFVDLCHQNGIAVIVDVVFNHAFSQNPLCQMYWDPTNFKPNSSSPFLNPDAKHPFNVGYDFNHESSYTQEYMYQILKFWVTEYKVDGYRFDLSKGFTQKNSGNDVGAWGRYDASRVSLLKQMANNLKNTDPNLFLILEHFADNDEEKELAEFGFMIWGNMVHEYTEATMGYSSNFNWGLHNERGWSKPNLVGYMESHDEERIAYKTSQFGNSNGSYNTKDLSTMMDRLALSANFFFPLPGPKMFWQFTELGYDVSIDQNGRTGKKPIRWNYLNDGSRKAVHDVFGELIHMKTELPVFNTGDVGYELTGTVKRIWLGSPSQKVFIIGNFNVTSQNVALRSSSTGWWYEFYTGDSINVTDPDMNITLAPGEYRLYSDVKMEKYFKEEDNTDGVEGLTSNQSLLQIAPNPATSQITIFLKDGSPLTGEWNITNIMGQELNTGTTNQVLDATINTSNLSSGMYYLNFEGEGGMMFRKSFLVE